MKSRVKEFAKYVVLELVAFVGFVGFVLLICEGEDYVLLLELRFLGSVLLGVSGLGFYNVMKRRGCPKFFKKLLDEETN